MRIAMWSGPRNLSTAMMYSFGNRSDFTVWDEPFYAPYLAKTGLPHPMAEKIIDTHETDPSIVAGRCLDPKVDESAHFYMKHMPHHMISGFPTAWAKQCVNVHLIRHPARVIASYGAKREDVKFADIGYAQQQKLYEDIGGLVIDSADILRDPEGSLRKLCGAIDLTFDPAMLRWRPGPRKEDGIWAKHWYNAVHKSQGFVATESPLPKLTGPEQKLMDAALPSYEALAKNKI